MFTKPNLKNGHRISEDRKIARENEKESVKGERRERAGDEEHKEETE